MNFEIFLQQITGGLAVGCIYALIALGFSMMLRATDLVNFAQGELVMAGGYFGYTLLTYTSLPYVVVFIVASVLTGLLAVIIERLALRPIRERQSPVLNLIIATVGIGICLRLLAQVVWGAEPIRYPSRVGGGTLLVAGLPVSSLHLWIILLAAVAMFALHLFLQRSLSGVAWRAAAYDHATAEILGIGFSRVVSLTFGISGALAGAAGVLIAPLFFVSLDLWLLGPRTFAAAAIGQFSILGTMIGGPVLGLIETLAAGYLSSAYKNGIAYAVMILVLMVIAIPRVPAGGSVGQIYARIPLTEVLAWSAERMKRWRRMTLVLGGVLVLLLPLVLDEYGVHVLVLILIYMIAALGLQLVIGYGGSIIIGHAAFVGAGAYVSALLSLKLGVPFPIALPGAAVFAGLLGLLFAPILRLPGHYCAIATLGFGEIMNLIMVNWKSVTNGYSGLSNIPQPRFGLFVVQSAYGFYYLALVLLILVYGALRRLVDSRFGRGLIAARENELAATAMGISVPWFRAQAFAIGAACAGITGSLYAHFNSFVSPDGFRIVDSIGFLVMVVVGGLGSLPGAIIGAVVVVGVPEVLRSLAQYRMLVYGALLVLFMMYLPGGLTDLVPRFIAVFFKKGSAPHLESTQGESQ
jgi:branched-chain amino acid transport system permease protein